MLFPQIGRKLQASKQALNTAPKQTNGAMRKGDHPDNIAPLFNPKSHAGTDAQPSSLCDAV